MESRAASELATQFRELGEYINRYVSKGAEPADVLARLVELALASVGNCNWAAITQASERDARTLAASDDIARLIDRVQTEAKEGPCVTAARDEMLLNVTDLAAESRWPVFVKNALELTPVRSILTFEVDPEEPRSALNLYADRPNAFGEHDVAVATLFALHAQIAMMHLNAATKSANLQQALTSSRQIGAAIGILMSARKITSDRAFDLLRESSQHLHRKLHDIAVEVTETGTLP